jgi:tripartite-type tricarboxylate transporter receptor subunit TctC
MVLGTAAMAADSFPSRIITMIVPYAAGGSTDTVGRVFADSMTRTLGQQVVVENVAGASGTLGATRVARADPDGYTILLHNNTHATNTLLYRELPYNAATAFAPLAIITTTPMTLSGKLGLPAASATELLDYIRTNKEEVTIANAGLGGPSHLCGMLLMSMLETKMTPVTYKGGGPMMNDLMGGQIDLACDQATNTLSHIKSGKIKGFAVTTLTPLPELPDLPTLDQAGLQGFETSVWHGFYLPSGTPDDVTEKLLGAVRSARQDPKVVERMAGLATQVASAEEMSPAALQAKLDAEITKWQPLIKAAGVYAD